MGLGGGYFLVQCHDSQFFLEYLFQQALFPLRTCFSVALLTSFGKTFLVFLFETLHLSQSPFCVNCIIYPTFNRFHRSCV